MALHEPFRRVDLVRRLVLVGPRVVRVVVVRRVLRPLELLDAPRGLVLDGVELQRLVAQALVSTCSASAPRRLSFSVACLILGAVRLMRRLPSGGLAAAATQRACSCAISCSLGMGGGETIVYVYRRRGLDAPSPTFFSHCRYFGSSDITVFVLVRVVGSPCSLRDLRVF